MVLRTGRLASILRDMSENRLPVLQTPFLSKMTCQICGGRFLAREGLIARHGHAVVRSAVDTSGYVSEGCPGSRQRPLELDRDALGDHLSALDLLAEGAIGDAADAYAAEIAHQDRRYKEWVQTVTEDQWDTCREAMNRKRNRATNAGWIKRRNGRR